MFRVFSRHLSLSARCPSVSWTHLLQENVAYVAGEWASASSGKTFSIINPANGSKLCQVPDMSAHEVQLAIRSAASEQPLWWKKPPEERSTVIGDWAQAIWKHREALASLITTENGKTLSDARAEVSSAVASLKWYAEESKRVYGNIIPALQNVHRRQLIHHQPVGIVGIITPWNFPLSMVTRKAGAALAAGCAVIIKPAEDTPLSALAITHLAVSDAKLPPGLLNTITASRNPEGAQLIGEILCKDPTVRLIGFTGSTSVGKHLYSQAAAHGKRVLLELGGNAPFIVFASANLDSAVTGLIASKFRCSGQTCVSANRVFVEDCIYDQFLEKLITRVNQLRTGDGFNPQTNIGPLINAAAVNKVETLVNSAKKSGSKAFVNGDLPTNEPLNRGYFYPPTVLANCTPDMACMQNEIFGPVAPVCRFRTETEAVELANSTPYGLAAYIYTQNIRQAWEVSDQLAFGMIGINSPKVSNAETPFGGIKDSGIGRECGPDALVEFMDVKTLNWDLTTD